MGIIGVMPHLRPLGAVCLALLLGGCQAPPPRDGITFSTMKPDQAEVWEVAFERFRRAHPDIPLHIDISPRSSTTITPSRSDSKTLRERS